MAHMMTLALQQQETVLRGFGQGLLAQVAQDYNLDHQELVKEYLSAPQVVQAQINNGDGIPASLEEFGVVDEELSGHEEEDSRRDLARLRQILSEDTDEEDDE